MVYIYIYMHIDTCGKHKKTPLNDLQVKEFNFTEFFTTATVVVL